MTGAALAPAPTLDLSDVDAHRRADVALDEVRVRNQQWDRANRRPKPLSAREGLAAVQFECLIVWTIGCTLQNFDGLCDDDRDRLTLALRRIDALVEAAL